MAGTIDPMASVSGFYSIGLLIYPSKCCPILGWIQSFLADFSWFFLILLVKNVKNPHVSWLNHFIPIFFKPRMLFLNRNSPSSYKQKCTSRAGGRDMDFARAASYVGDNPPKKSWFNMVYGRYIGFIMDVNRVYKPTYNWGAPSCL
jgi:hypothetical protein